MIHEKSVVTIERHIIDQQRKHPEATGIFTTVLSEIALAAKMISREVNMAGLIDILGGLDRQNVQGEEVQKLDEWANDVIFAALDHGGTMCCMASEESEDPLMIPERFPVGPYVLLYDPLDGSSNIDANVSIGTIFSIHRKVSNDERGTLEDCLQPGHRQIAAGYVVYGSSTMLVYTTGNGVHGFTLDPMIGEFLLSHPNICIPDPPKRIYSVNEGNYGGWSQGQRRLVDHIKALDGVNKKAFSSRYIGSLVADFHRNLLYGGLFMYPADHKHPNGKLRLLYEAAPLAFICEHAGGRATDGHRDINTIVPHELHQRTPLFIGARSFVDMVERFLREDAAMSATV